MWPRRVWSRSSQTKGRGELQMPVNLINKFIDLRNQVNCDIALCDHLKCDIALCDQVNCDIASVAVLCDQSVTWDTLSQWQSRITRGV